LSWKQNVPANADCEGSIRPIASFDDGHLPAEIAPRSIEDLVRVTVLLGIEAAVMGVGVGNAAVVRVRHDAGIFSNVATQGTFKRIVGRLYEELRS
jgi:hypothetical protein